MNLPPVVPPLSSEQEHLIQQLSTQGHSLQLAWLSGYLWAIAQQATPNAAQHSDTQLAAVPAETANAQTDNVPTLTILSASQTGNARQLAEKLYTTLSQMLPHVRLVSAGQYANKSLADERWIISVVSTQGEGDPPEEAIPFYKFLSSRKAPKLEQLQYCILALGDSSYEQYCQAGKALDQAFQHLGAKSFYPLVELDIDYANAAEQWQHNLCEWLSAHFVTQSPTISASPSLTQQTQTLYSKTQPFSSTLLTKQAISGRGSDKSVLHLELDLTDSGLQYNPGDSLGVIVQNSAEYVEKIIAACHLDSNEMVNLKTGQYSLSEALKAHLELSLNGTQWLKQYATHSQNTDLQKAITDTTTLNQLATTSVAAILQHYPPQSLSAQQLVDLLKPLTPRLYSIASAQDYVDDEVHLTVSLVDSEFKGECYRGTASQYLASLEEGEQIGVYVEPAPHFRLPEQDKPIIMIAAGTGIAPFRGFMQAREANNATGKNWLFFGNPYFTEDFSYQVEWQNWHEKGLLHNIHLAWSRDQEEKVYVHHLLTQQATHIWDWIQTGAHLYVCGNASTLGKSVDQALLNIIAQQGNMDLETADEYLTELRIQQRYQRDVY